MKVYVIEKGDYSDRHIIGVVENKEDAKRICNSLTSERDYSISWSEWDTNQFVTNKIRYVVMDDNSDYYQGWSAEYDDYEFYKDCTDNQRIYDGCYVIFANSAQQAIKIAQDMKAQMKAEKEGIVI